MTQPGELVDRRSSVESSIVPTESTERLGCRSIYLDQTSCPRKERRSGIDDVKLKSRLFACFQTYAFFMQSRILTYFFNSGIPFGLKIMLSSQLLGACVVLTIHLPSGNDCSRQREREVSWQRVARDDWPSKSGDRLDRPDVHAWLGRVPPRA